MRHATITCYASAADGCRYAADAAGDAYAAAAISLDAISAAPFRCLIPRYAAIAAVFHY